MGTPAAGPGDSGLLAGLRVLDLSNYTPGPFATQILADLGATVLKVERPPHGDLERLSVPEYFHAYNRGKRSIALNLQDADDRAMPHKLVPMPMSSSKGSGRAWRTGSGRGSTSFAPSGRG